MLTKKELTDLKKALPAGGLKKVAERSGYSYANVQSVLRDPKRYNSKIIYAAIAIAEEHKQELIEMKEKVKKAIS